MKNRDNFHYKGKLSHATTKSTFFVVNKDEWDTKEDTGMHCGIPKGISRTLNSEKIKPVALAIVWLV